MPSEYDEPKWDTHSFSSTNLKNWVIPIGMASIKNKNQTNKQTKIGNKCWQGCGEIGNLVQCWWECKMDYGTSKKLNVELAYNPAIPLLSMHSK